MSARASGEKIICECLGVSEARILDAIRRGELTSVREVTACTEAGSGCTACHPAIRDYLARGQRRRKAELPAALAYAASSPSFSAK